VNEIVIGVAAALLVTPVVHGASMRIPCDMPTGIAQEFGITLGEMDKAKEAGNPRPPNHFTPAVSDAMKNKLTFFVDATHKKMTIVLADSLEDIKLRADSLKAGIPAPPSMPPLELKIVYYSPTTILAVGVLPLGGVETYSLFPTLGIVMMTSQLLITTGEEAIQTAYYAKCDFSGSAAR
jgi:hypothetical protein